MIEPAGRAELIEDDGAAAAGEEFFRSPAFLAAEGTTHTLRIVSDHGAELVAPLLVREIPGADGARDAVSPYGYPGLVPPSSGRTFDQTLRTTATATGGEHLGGERLDPAAIDFSGTGLVSAFVRHNLAEPPPLAGTTERTLVQVADPALPPKSRPSDRRQVRRNLEAGYVLTLVPASETTAPQRAGFLDLYEQTMRRTGAAAHYFFDAEYFEAILSAGERTWLALAAGPDGDLAAASIAVVSDGFLHYYLSGSADSHLRDSPMKNVVARLAEHAAEMALPLNLGGGISRGDALEEFKRGFANREQGWHSSELVCDAEAYARLSTGKEAAGFFPAYRAL